MKKAISLILCLLMIFSSVNFAFAVDWSTTDQNNLQSIKNSVNSGGALYNLVTTCYNNLVSQLFIDDADVGRKSITWWMREAVKDLDQLVGNGNGTILNYLGNIYNRLVDIKNSAANIYTESNTIRTKLTSLIEDYITPIRTAINSYLPSINTATNAINTRDQVNGFEGQNGGASVTVRQMGANGAVSDAVANFTSLNWRASISTFLMYLNNNLVRADGYQLNGYNSLQNYRNWQTLTLDSFTPTSQTSGIYTWLKLIQDPISRLAYVHASDEEIAARQKAAANQTAVVNNFIDSSGSGAAPASSFGDVASMSSGYTSNMNTDAQASGIWNIFNSNNFGWFSQETANQLDTTVSTRKGSSGFDTPLLDQQITDIYKELGVDVND